MSYVIKPTGTGGKPLGNIRLLRLGWSSVSAVTIAAGECRDSTNTFNIINLATRTANITSSGAGGLDTGSEASNTWYAVHIIDDSSGVNTEDAMLSLSATAPTMPSGYDVFRRVGWVRNDGTSDFLKFYQTGEDNTRRIAYDEEFSAIEVLNNGSATTHAAVDLSNLVPSTSISPVLSVEHESTGDSNSAYFRPTGATGDDNGFWFGPGAGGDKGFVAGYGQIEVPTNASQSIDYKLDDSGDSLYLYVVAYYDEL